MKANRKMLEAMWEASRLSLISNTNAAAALQYPLLRSDQHVPRFITRSCTNHAGTRSYKLFLPSGYHGQALPLVVMLHGCKQSPDDFATGTGMNDMAEEMQCLVAYPAQTSHANGFRCWNWFNPANQQRDQGEPSIIADITRDIIETYGVDRQRVYIAGLSAGGSMALILGTAYPELYAAVGVHSGLPYAGANDMYSALNAMRNGARRVSENKDQGRTVKPDGRAIPMIVFHGDMDTTVHPDNGDRVMAHGAPDSTGSHPSPDIDIKVERSEVPGGHAYTRTVHADRSGRIVAEQWLVHGARHAWSGGNAAGSFTAPRGPDATKAMLRFFYSQTLIGSSKTLPASCALLSSLRVDQ